MIYIRIDEKGHVILAGQVIDSEMERLGFVAYDGDIPIITDLEYSYLAFVNGKLTICFYEDKIDKLSEYLVGQIKIIHDSKLNILVKDVTNAEMHSWGIQTSEAQSIINGVTRETPLIDALIISRKMNETKEELAKKIINAKQQYELEYASILGDYQYNLKRIKKCEIISELLTLKMELLNEFN